MQEVLNVADRQIPYSIRYHHLAKNISLKFHLKKGLEIVLPNWMSERQALAFLIAKKDWVLKYADKYNEIIATSLKKNNIYNGQNWQIMGQNYNIAFVPRSFKQMKAKLVGDQIQLHARYFDPDICLDTISKFFKKYAKQAISDRAFTLANKVNTTLSYVTVRSQYSRWGSCTRKRSISLNWRLIFAPLEIIDTVIYHELAHLTHMNHSKAFWQVYQAYDSNCLNNDYWLKQKGNEILSLL